MGNLHKMCYQMRLRVKRVVFLSHCLQMELRISIKQMDSVPKRGGLVGYWVLLANMLAWLGHGFMRTVLSGALRWGISSLSPAKCVYHGLYACCCRNLIRVDSNAKLSQIIFSFWRSKGDCSHNLSD